MNTSDIEYHAVTEITRSLMKSRILRPEIPVNDKTPTWDGEIFVYEEGKDRSKKEGIQGKIPVQVKGKCVKSFPGNSYKYSVSVTDLHNYSNDGGALYFVCLMNNDFEKFKIYYLDLLPLKIQTILCDLRSNQKNITLKFKQFPNKIEEVEELTKKILWHRKKQMSCSKIIEIDETKTHYMPFFRPEESKVGEDIYVYTKSQEGEYIPISCPKLSEIKRTLNQNISVAGEIFFTEYDVVENEQGRFLKVKNDLFVLDFEHNRFKFNIVGTLTDRLNISKFILKMDESKKIEIAGVEIKIETGLEECKKNKITKVYNHLKDIQNLLELLNVEINKLDIELLKENNPNLNLLIDVFLYHRTFTLPSEWKNHIEFEKDINFINLKIGNLKLALVLMRGSENKYTLKNYFSDWVSEKYVFSIRYDNGEVFDSIPLFLTTTLSDLKMDNMNFKKLVSNIQSYDLSTVEPVIINKFLLELIHLYDFNHNKEILDFALELCSLLTEKESDTYHIINRLQILKRIEAFDEERECMVYDILNECTDSETKCACYLLLGKKKMFEKYFENLPSKTQDSFKRFPIYTLLNRAHS